MNRRNFFKLAASVLAALGLPNLVTAKESPCVPASQHIEVLTTDGWVKLSDFIDNCGKYTLVDSDAEPGKTIWR